MGLLDGIEKLINEHGSATILRERLEHAKEQYGLLESQKSELLAQVGILESEKQNLRAQLAEALRENQRLQQKIQQSSSHAVTYKMKWGCVVFDGDETLYCPSCYFGGGRRVPTSRKGMRFRFCAVCKTEIPVH